MHLAPPPPSCSCHTAPPPLHQQHGHCALPIDPAWLDCSGSDSSTSTGGYASHQLEIRQPVLEHLITTSVQCALCRQYALQLVGLLPLHPRHSLPIFAPPSAVAPTSQQLPPPPSASSSLLAPLFHQQQPHASSSSSPTWTLQSIGNSRFAVRPYHHHSSSSSLPFLPPSALPPPPSISDIFSFISQRAGGGVQLDVCGNDASSSSGVDADASFSRFKYSMYLACQNANQSHDALLRFAKQLDLMYEAIALGYSFLRAYYPQQPQHHHLDLVWLLNNNRRDQAEFFHSLADHVRFASASSSSSFHLRSSTIASKLHEFFFKSLTVFETRQAWDAMRYGMHLVDASVTPSFVYRDLPASYPLHTMCDFFLRSMDNTSNSSPTDRERAARALAASTLQLVDKFTSADRWDKLQQQDSASVLGPFCGARSGLSSTAEELSLMLRVVDKAQLVDRSAVSSWYGIAQVAPDVLGDAAHVFFQNRVGDYRKNTHDFLLRFRYQVNDGGVMMDDGHVFASVKRTTDALYAIKIGTLAYGDLDWLLFHLHHARQCGGGGGGAAGGSAALSHVVARHVLQESYLQQHHQLVVVPPVVVEASPPPPPPEKPRTAPPAAAPVVVAAVEAAEEEEAKSSPSPQPTPPLPAAPAAATTPSPAPSSSSQRSFSSLLEDLAPSAPYPPSTTSSSSSSSSSRSSSSSAAAAAATAAAAAALNNNSSQVYEEWYTNKPNICVVRLPAVYYDFVTSGSNSKLLQQVAARANHNNPAAQVTIEIVRAGKVLIAPCAFKLQGRTKDNTQFAVRLFREAVLNLGLCEARFRISKRAYSQIVGKNGERIASIRERSACKVFLSDLSSPPPPAAADDYNHQVCLFGYAEQVFSAMALVRRFCSDEVLTATAAAPQQQPPSVAAAPPPVESKPQQQQQPGPSPVRRRSKASAAAAGASAAASNNNHSSANGSSPPSSPENRAPASLPSSATTSASTATSASSSSAGALLPKKQIDDALFKAVQRRDWALAAQLIDSDEGVHFVAASGTTVLHKAAERNAPESIVQSLLELGLDANQAVFDKGYAAIHFAIKGNSKPGVVGLLLHFGASANALCERGCTPLHLAVRRNAVPDIVQLLLDHGADVDLAEEETGLTPLQLARQQHSGGELVKLLQQHQEGDNNNNHRPRN